MQKGNLVFKSGGWYCRYYEGKQRRSKHLGYVKDYPTKTSIVPVMEDFMRRVNSSTAPAIKLDEFIEFRYLPYAKELRPSTHRGYVSLWHAKIKGLAEAQLRVRDYRTMDVQLLLNAIAAKRELAKSTHTHIKAFLSGVFRYAVLAGVRESNPVRECKIPKGRPPAKTYAYSLDEIKRLLMVLDGGWKVAVAIAGYAGLRRAELQGLEWSDYDGKDLHINRNVWRGIKTEPKSVASKDYVPVIPSLKVILDDYKARATTIPVLPDLAHTHVAMRRLLKGTGLEWRGWHSFRRGLATNLGELGVAPKVIQRIMRHSHLDVTMTHYVKARDGAMDDAMAKLSGAIVDVANA